MKRIILMVLRNILFVPWWWFQLMWYAREKDTHTPQQRSALLKKIVRGANKGGRVTIKATGQENIPKENGFILYPNHQGMYDVLALIDSCDKPISVVMKQEVKDVVLLKQVRRIMGAKAMDRGDIKQSLKIITEVTKEVSEGKNFVIFAEGTRSKLGNKLLDFKGGSFKAATRAKCPIVPVALIDSFVPFDSHSIRPVTVQVHYLAPILFEEYQGMKTVEIAAMVKERIEQAIADAGK